MGSLARLPGGRGKPPGRDVLGAAETELEAAGAAVAELRADPRNAAAVAAVEAFTRAVTELAVEVRRINILDDATIAAERADAVREALASVAMPLPLRVV